MADDKKIQIILYGAIVSVLAAAITALLKDNGSVWSRVKTFIAGVCCGILLNLLLMNSHLDQSFKDVISAAGAAFVSTVWPLFGKLTIKIIQKKGDDIIQDSKPD